MLPDKLGPATEIQELRDAFARGADAHRAVGTRDGRRARRPAAAGARGPPPGEEQSPGGRVAAQYPRPQRRDARGARGLCGDRPARRGACRSSTAIISPRWRKTAGSRCGRCCRSWPPSCAPARPRQRAALAIDLDLETVYTTQDVAVAVAFLITEIIEFAMLRAPAEPVEVSLRRTSELTARLESAARYWCRTRPTPPDKVQFERVIGGPGQAIALDPGTQARPLQCRFAGLSSDLNRPPIVTAARKKVSEARNRRRRQDVM